MRFSTVLVGAFAALASAQSTTAAPSTTAPATPTSVSLDPAQSSAAACLNACKVEDVDCKAKCVPVPHPSFDQVEKLQACVAECVKNQGNGTESDNIKFGQCRDTCITQNYHNTATTGGAQPTGGSGSGSGSGSGAGGSGGSSSGAGANPTGGAGGNGTTGGSGAGGPSGAGSLHAISAVGLLSFLAAFALL